MRHIHAAPGLLRVEVGQLAEQGLHPGRQRCETIGQVLADGGTVHRVYQCSGEPVEDVLSIRCQSVLEPVQRLHYAHRRSARPVEAAGRRQLELDGQVVQLDRAPAGVGWSRVRYGIGQPQIVSRGQPIDRHAQTTERREVGGNPYATGLCSVHRRGDLGLEAGHVQCL